MKLSIGSQRVKEEIPGTPLGLTYLTLIAELFKRTEWSMPLCRIFCMRSRQKGGMDWYTTPSTSPLPL